MSYSSLIIEYESYINSFIAIYDKLRQIAISGLSYLAYHFFEIEGAYITFSSTIQTYFFKVTILGKFP